MVNETFVKNSVMNEKDVKNIVMDAKTDPKVVMDLSILKIGGWHTLQPGNNHFLEQFMDENEPWLLRRIPNREIFCCVTTLGTTFCESGSTHEEIVVTS